jgi:DHA2 family multidrug resistance protein-like MFS transporter
MDATNGTRATRREWIGLAVLALPCALYAMDLTVLHLAVPQLSKELAPSATELLWIIDVYGFLVAGCLITMGTLGDRIGRRRMLMLGAGAFAVASVLAAFSTSAEMLIATRALLGVAGATVAPSTMSLIRNMFRDPKQFTTAIGIWIASYSAGAAIGPVVGGVLLESFWWGSVFLLAVPVMGLVMVLGPLLLPEYRDPAAGRPDLPSTALAVGAVLGPVFGLKQVAVEGLGPVAAASIAGGAVLAALFVRRQRVLADPLIDLSLFANRAFTAGLALYTLSILTVFGAFLFVPQYLQLVRGLSPLEAGLWSLPWALAFVVGSTATPRLAVRLPRAPLIAGGLGLAAVGNAMLAWLDGSTSMWVLAAANVLVGLGLSPMMTLANDLILSNAPPERAGAASGISETGAELGVALGIAVLGSVGAAIYRGHLAAALPAGVPAEAAAAARETLGGAVVAAGQLPDDTAAALLAAARAGFVEALQVGAVASAVASVGLAALTVVMLRNVPVGEPTPGRPDAADADAAVAPEPVREDRAGDAGTGVGPPLRRGERRLRGWRAPPSPAQHRSAPTTDPAAATRRRRST